MEFSLIFCLFTVIEKGGIDTCGNDEQQQKVIFLQLDSKSGLVEHKDKVLFPLFEDFIRFGKK